MVLKSFTCAGNLLNIDSYSFNGVIFFLILKSLNKFWFFSPTGVIIRNVTPVGAKKTKQNSLKSVLNSLGWEKTTKLGYPHIKRFKCHLLISFQTLYITLGWPVMQSSTCHALTVILAQTNTIRRTHAETIYIFHAFKFPWDCFSQVLSWCSMWSECQYVE